ncbi:MAG: PAS domain S-box protein, partial [Candidatus Hydrogenedentota bacterium]
AILDAFHASVTPSREFICLHSTAQFIGGLFIALIWLPDRLAQTRTAKHLPKASVAAAGLFGVISLVFPEILPIMVSNGRFALAPQMLNLTGGVFFFAGLVYFARRFSRDHGIAHLLFTAYCLMFAVSGVTFGLSGLWGAGWWLSHLVRLGAYAIAFSYVSINTAAEYRRLNQTEEAVRRLAAIVESSGDAIIGKALDGTIVSWNLGAKNIYGYSAEEVQGQSGSFLVPPDRPDEEVEILERIKKGQKVDCFETVRKKNNGELIDVSLSISPIQDSHGKMIGISTIARDISARKRAEEDLKRTTTSIENLNREINERKKAEESATLACKELEKANLELKEMQSQLVQSEKLASIGQLAAGVAHEMNTPLGFVSCNFQTLENYVKKIQELLEMYGELAEEIEALKKTELLNKADTIEETRRAMKIDFVLEDLPGLFNDSEEGLEAITNIVLNLRDFSRVDQPGSLARCNINDGIETTLVVTQNETKYHADIKTQLSEVPPILCNSGQINQVILNILMNATQAIKSQERGDKGTIIIKTYTTDNDVVCEISDDGCGIPSNDLLRIFDPFFTTKPVSEGTGLGLSISHDIIVTKHKGKLLVDSTVGKGTKFTIKLPINKKKPLDKQETECYEKENSIICGR